ncbi:MAG: type II toxin-antitoxin system HicB family antitoxin [Abitibacteriaceae bacterium]|nr:type II toxin-antitoxin system HicB family antitoxin [Abditibacteriaceae bacterium]MBV9866071.1 type II toxin-antitoxin system HicB family antitoxin [Abditibacteriaceae bacterium]
MKLTCVVTPDELYGGASGYVSRCPELGVASQGETIEEARAMLREAVEGFLEVADAQEIQRRLAENAGMVSTLEINATTYAEAA